MKTTCCIKLFVHGDYPSELLSYLDSKRAVRHKASPDFFRLDSDETWLRLYQDLKKIQKRSDNFAFFIIFLQKHVYRWTAFPRRMLQRYERCNGGLPEFSQRLNTTLKRIEAMGDYYRPLRKTSASMFED